MTDCCKRLQNVSSVKYRMAMRRVYFSNYNLLKILVFVETPVMMPGLCVCCFKVIKKFPTKYDANTIQRI